MDGSNKATFSFAFTKRTEAKKLQSSAIKDIDPVRKEETDYLVSLEENEIKRFVLCVSSMILYSYFLHQTFE